MALSSVEYTAGAAQTDFTITFGYVEKSYIEVRVNAVLKNRPADWDFFDDTTVRFVTPMTGGETVNILRNTDTTTRVTDFVDGSMPRESELDDQFDQLFHKVQEVEENFASSISLVGGHWDIQSKRLENVATPVADTDAATKGSIQPQVDAATSAASTATTQASAASASASAAATSAANAATSETNAAASEAAISAVLDIAPADPGDNGLIPVVRSGAYSNEDWATKADVATSTDNSGAVGRVETSPASGTEWAVSVTVPAAGTWNVEVHALLLMRQTASGSGTWNDIQFELDHEVGGGGFSPVAGFGQMFSPHNYGSGSGASRVLSASLAYTLEAAASGLHEFRVDLVALNAGLELYTTGVYVHRLQVKAYRTA